MPHVVFIAPYLNQPTKRKNNNNKTKTTKNKNTHITNNNNPNLLGLKIGRFTRYRLSLPGLEHDRQRVLASSTQVNVKHTENSSQVSQASPLNETAENLTRSSWPHSFDHYFFWKTVLQQTELICSQSAKHYCSQSARHYCSQRHTQRGE